MANHDIMERPDHGIVRLILVIWPVAFSPFAHGKNILIERYILDLNGLVRVLRVDV
jgi:hypothetical protein